MAALLITGTAHAQKLSVVEVWRTKGEPETALFASISGMAEAVDGSIWVSDPRAGVVLSIDSALTIHVIARSGEGPGEVSGPTRIARTPEGGLAVYDLSGQRIEIFNRDGEFARRVMLEVPIWNSKGFAISTTGQIILSGGIPGASFFRHGDLPEGNYGIHRFSPDGELVDSWWSIPDTQNPRAAMYVAGGPVDILENGSILFSDAAPHRILKFSADQNDTNLIASNPDLLEPVGDDFITVTGSGASRQVTFDWQFPQSRLITQLPSGRLLNVVEFHEQGRTLFQLYTSDGASLAKTWVDNAYTAWSTTRDGDILAEWVDPTTHESYAVRLELTYTQ